MRALIVVMLCTVALGAQNPRTRAAAAFRDRVQTSVDVTWLEKLASEEGVVEALAPSLNSPKTFRSQAYVRLGALGTPAAIAAARRVEQAARSWTVTPLTASLDRLPHPAGHVGDFVPRPFAQLDGADGRTYGLVALNRLGGRDVFLITTRSPASGVLWTRPVLLENRAPFGIRAPLLSWVTDGRLRFTFDPVADDREPAALRAFGMPPETRPLERQRWELLVANITQDTDGDGWTDTEEARLGTRPDLVDSDGDGLSDGVDPCPLFAPPPAEASDEEATILKKAFFAAYGVHGSHDLLFVAADSRRLQLWGSRGPILYGVDRPRWQSTWGDAPPQLSWKIATPPSTASRDTATVTISDYIAPLAAAGYTVTLRRIDGEWFVVAIGMNWIS